MVSKFALFGGGCSCFSWVLMILAWCLPLFSRITVFGSGDDTYEIGVGIWGVGTCLSGSYCTDNVDKSCYDYDLFSSIKSDRLNELNNSGIQEIEEFDEYIHTDWQKGAEAASVLGIMIGLATVILSFVNKWKSAVIGASVTLVFAIVLFAIWEERFCRTIREFVDVLFPGVSINEVDDDCSRSWSYGLQVVAFFVNMFSIAIFVLGGTNH